MSDNTTSIRNNLIRHSLAGIIVILFPWLVLFELLPISYARMSVMAEVLLYAFLIILLIAIVVLLRKDIKYLKGKNEGEDTEILKNLKGIGRLIGILLFLDIITVIVLLVILVAIGIAFIV